MKRSAGSFFFPSTVFRPFRFALSFNEYSTRKGSPRCKAENPRYKCQVRLSALPLEPPLSLSLSLSLQLPLEPPSLYAFLFRHRGWFRLSLPLTGAVSLPSPSFCRYLLPGLLPTVPEFSPPVPCFLPNYRPFRVYTYTSLPSVVKSNPLVVPCSRFFVCSFSLSLSLSRTHSLLRQSSRWRNNKHKVQREERNNGRA